MFSIRFFLATLNLLVNLRGKESLSFFPHSSPLYCVHTHCNECRRQQNTKKKILRLAHKRTLHVYNLNKCKDVQRSEKSLEFKFQIFGIYVNLSCGKVNVARINLCSVLATLRGHSTLLLVHPLLLPFTVQHRRYLEEAQSHLSILLSTV